MCTEIEFCIQQNTQLNYIIILKTHFWIKYEQVKIKLDLLTQTMNHKSKLRLYKWCEYSQMMQTTMPQNVIRLHDV